MSRGLKFRIKDIEGLYYLFSENLVKTKALISCMVSGYQAADRHLHFRIYEQRHEKTKTQSSFAVTMKLLISAFVLAS